VYLAGSQRWSESRIYFAVVWSTVAAGVIILLSGVNQPLLLLVIAACLNGMVMFVYAILLIQLNRRGLPPALRVHGVRLGMLAFATLFYGFFSGWLVIVQVRSYLSGS
jgi:hypothetical protein